MGWGEMRWEWMERGRLMDGIGWNGMRWDGMGCDGRDGMVFDGWDGIG